jgi:hypothetical protein
MLARSGILASRCRAWARAIVWLENGSMVNPVDLFYRLAQAKAIASARTIAQSIHHRNQLQADLKLLHYLNK